MRMALPGRRKGQEGAPKGGPVKEGSPEAAALGEGWGHLRKTGFEEEACWEFHVKKKRRL